MSKDKFSPPSCILYTCCGSKCKKKGGKHLFKFLKNHVKEQKLRKSIQIIKTGCTDRCKHGPVIAQMPANIWHFHMTEHSAIDLLDRSLRRED